MSVWGMLRAAAGGMVLVFGMVSVAQATTFYEHDGVVVVEVESVPTADNWYARTGSFVLSGSNTVAGYTGDACYQFEGNAESGGSVNGIMTYDINIQTPGTYQLYMRSMKAPIETGEGDKGNDCYVKMNGQDGCVGQFTKYVVLDESYKWSWAIKLECSHHTFSDARYDLSAGTHRFQIAGRSKNFVIDRFAMVLMGSTVNPYDIDLPESPTDPNVDPLPLVVYEMKALDFPYSGTGYVRQNIWISLDAANDVRQATVGDAFPFVSGEYNVRLYAVAENTGRSTYRAFAGDNLIGTYEVPLTDQAVELGTDFRGAWDNVQINTGDEIRIEANAGTLDNSTWTRAGWQKITFMPQFDPNNVATASPENQPRMVPHKPVAGRSGIVYTLDGRRAPRAAAAMRSEASRGIYVVESRHGAGRLIAR